MTVLPLRSVKVTEPSLTVPAELVTVALRLTFWALVLKVAVADVGVVAVGAAATAPTVKTPSTPSLLASVGAGFSSSGDTSLSFMSVNRPFSGDLASRLIGDGPGAAAAFTVKSIKNREPVVSCG